MTPAAQQDVLDWLLAGDPAIRWQTLRDLAVAPAAEVRAERNRVATEGWGSRLLSLQGSDGQWAGGTYWPAVDDDPVNQPWTATTYSLLLLRDFGLVPDSPQARRAVSLVRENSRWEQGNQPFSKVKLNRASTAWPPRWAPTSGNTWTVWCSG